VPGRVSVPAILVLVLVSRNQGFVVCLCTMQLEAASTYKHTLLLLNQVFPTTSYPSYCYAQALGLVLSLSIKHRSMTALQPVACYAVPHCRAASGGLECWS